MNRIRTAGVAAILALSAVTPAEASEKGWDDAGTVAKNTWVVAAFGAPAVQGDWEGVLEAGDLRDVEFIGHVDPRWGR